MSLAVARQKGPHRSGMPDVRYEPGSVNNLQQFASRCVGDFEYAKIALFSGSSLLN